MVGEVLVVVTVEHFVCHPPKDDVPSMLLAFSLLLHAHARLNQSVVSPRRAAEADEALDPRIKEMPKFRDRPDKYTGKCFVVRDNIDTDQIIPAEYLTLVPSKVTFCLDVGNRSCAWAPHASVLGPRKGSGAARVRSDYVLL